MAKKRARAGANASKNNSRNHDQDSGFGKSPSVIDATDNDIDDDRGPPILESSMEEEPPTEKPSRRPPRLTPAAKALHSSSSAGKASVLARESSTDKIQANKRAAKKISKTESAKIIASVFGSRTKKKPAAEKKAKKAIEKLAPEARTGRITRSAHHEQSRGNESVEEEAVTEVAGTSASKTSSSNKTGKRKARNVDDEEPPSKKKSMNVSRATKVASSRATTEPGRVENQNEVIEQETVRVEIDPDPEDPESDTENQPPIPSPQFYDPVPAPPPHNASGRSILKKGFGDGGRSLLETSNHGSSIWMNRSPLEMNATVPGTSAETISDKNMQSHHDQLKAKVTRFNHTNNHTRYIFDNFNIKRRIKPDLRIQTLKRAAGLLPGFNSGLLSSRAVLSAGLRNRGARPDTPVPGKDLQSSQTSADSAHGSGSRTNSSSRHVNTRRGHSRNSGIFEPLATSSPEKGNQDSGEGPDADVAPNPLLEERSPTPAPTSHRVSVVDQIDFDSVKVVSKLMRHIEKDDNRRLIDIILSRDKIGSIICEEILKRGDSRKRIQEASTKLDNLDLISVSEGLLSKQVDSIMQSSFSSISCLPRPAYLGDMSNGFLSVMFHFLDEAAKESLSKSSNENSTLMNGGENQPQTLEDLQKSVVRRLAVNIVKNDSEALKLLNEEIEHEKSYADQLQSFIDMLKVIRGSKERSDEIQREAKVAANLLLEIITESLRFNVT